MIAHGQCQFLRSGGVVALYGNAFADARMPGVTFRHAVGDNESFGEAGAQFLLRKKLRHFAYVPAIVADEPLDYRQRAFVRQIVERASTVDVSGTARSVALACEYMRRNAASPIGIGDIVAASGTSRRLLERHFRAVMGTTAAHELQRIRLELVKRQLEETDLPLGRVGDACGFRDESHLKKLFKRMFGVTMGDYRRARR